MRVFVLGGERGRALVLAREADSASKLDAAHDELEKDVDRSGSYFGDEDEEQVSSEDQIAFAERRDNALVRGGDLAARIAHPPAATGHARDVSKGAVRRWIRANLELSHARRIDFVPGVTAGAAEPSIALEALAQPAAAVDRGPVGDATALISQPARAARAIDELTLPSGLRVVLAPDPGATTVDLRLVMPVGTRNAHDPKTALVAAAGLRIDPEDAKLATSEVAHALDHYAKIAARTSVDVTATSTQFRIVGLASAAEWHVFGLAWLVTRGSDPATADGADAARRFRAQAYRPTGATLIVAGGFDASAIRAAIATWFGPWQPAPAEPLPVGKPEAITTLHQRVDGATATSFVMRPSTPATTASERAARALVAALVQARLATDLDDAGQVAVTYQPRGDETLTITVQLDPAKADKATAVMIARELGRLHDHASPTAEELALARRTAIADRLAASIGPAGRAQDLAQAVETGSSLDDADRQIDAMRTVTGDDLTAAAEILLAPIATAPR